MISSSDRPLDIVEMTFRILRLPYIELSDSKLRAITKPQIFNFLKSINPKNIYLYRNNTMSLVTFNRWKYRVFDITKSEFSKLRYISPGLEMMCIMDGVLKSKILSGVKVGKNMHPVHGIIDEEELISPLLMKLNRPDYLDYIKEHVERVWGVHVEFVDADYECLIYTSRYHLFVVPTSTKIANILRSKFECRRSAFKVPRDYPLFAELSLALYGVTTRQI